MAKLFKYLRTMASSCLLLASLHGMAQNQAWSVSSSDITFKIKNAGLTVSGSFGVPDAKIVFDGEKAAGNKIEASLDAKSINTGITARDNHLRKAEYFDAETYPKIRMNANLFSKQGPGKYTGYFSLTLKNTTRAVSVPFEFREAGNQATFTGSFTINRRDFGIGSSSWIMADDVIVTIVVTAIKK